ncbi:MAG: hypothetical protein QOJ39_2746 [Candidatus Eremiobacteraeota bacterium]|nr:hypothetical protein [Candidatus Eremiobacteraeota bacterium]
MTMTVSGDQLLMSGRIVADDAARFNALLDANPSVTTVVLYDSPGGAAAANDAIAASIETHRLDTVVAGFCVSACAMIFLSGTQRSFGDLEPIETVSLGFHGNYVRGQLGSERRLHALRERVLARTNRKIDAQLVDRWLHLEDDRSSVRFRFPGGGAPSVFFCAIGRFPNAGNYGSCEAIAGTDALSAGIITSTRIVHVVKSVSRALPAR